MSTEIVVDINLQRPNFNLDVDLRLSSKGITAVFGQSGSGKTSLLRCIAGLERAAEARVIFNDVVWQDQNKFIPVHQRPIGYVFQEDSLFEHLNARKNLEFAIKRSSRKITSDFNKIIDLLNIGKILDQFPHQLSGGEKQRVAIARALLIEPSLLLMDEPLASLDHQRKQEFLPYLENLRVEFKLPIIYVSHSINEITRLADELVVLNDGRVEVSGELQQCLTTKDLANQLAEESSNVVLAKVVDIDKQWQMAKVNFTGGELWIRNRALQIGDSIRVRILARDISLALNKHEDSSIANILAATIIELHEQQSLSLVKLQIGESTLVARISSRSVRKLNLSPGLKVWAQIKSVAIV